MCTFYIIYFNKISVNNYCGNKNEFKKEEHDKL